MLGQQRSTLCVSSQVGCQMGCTFCATGTIAPQSTCAWQTASLSPACQAAQQESGNMKSGASSDFDSCRDQSCERGQLLSFTKLSCYPLRRHHGLEGGPDSGRDRGAAGACSPGDHHKECGLHGALHPSESITTPASCATSAGRLPSQGTLSRQKLAKHIGSL